MRLAGSGRALVAILLPEEPRPPPVPPPPQADFLAGQLLGPRPQCTSDWNNALKLGYDVQRLRYPDWLGAGAAALGLAPDALPAVVRPSQAFVWRAVRRGGRFGEGGGAAGFLPLVLCHVCIYSFPLAFLCASAGSASQHFGVIFFGKLHVGVASFSQSFSQFAALGVGSKSFVSRGRMEGGALGAQCTGQESRFLVKDDSHGCMVPKPLFAF